MAGIGIGIAGIVAFAIALIMEVADLGKGHFTYTTFALIGLLCLAIFVVWALWGGRGWRGRTAA